MTRAGYESADRVLTITLNGPAHKNALTFELYAELRDRFIGLKNDASVKAIVLTGAGSDFCSGGDVHEIIGPLTQRTPEQLLEFTQMTGDLVKAMRKCPQPIVAAVDGACAGAGAILAMASDIRLGTERSRVAFLFVRVGLAGSDMGACAMLPRIIGLGRAAELLYTGRSMPGTQAYEWGFYNELCSSDELHPRAIQLARSIAHGPSVAHATTKRMLHEEWAMPLDRAIDAEAEAQARCMETNDFRRAYKAFVAKQAPQFEGD
ncbi:MAG: enoyl-CoA hydratase family protein [Candidatus Eremiobacteraeota bacterium]|nr:enoyl-CoA hydratase family protein [Candidatus Eremiobacteraeota bacterium]